MKIKGMRLICGECDGIKDVVGDADAPMKEKCKCRTFIAVTYADDAIMQVIKTVPLKFKDVLIFEPPDGFEDKDMFDFGWKDFWLCQTKENNLEWGDGIVQDIINTSEYYVVETKEPQPGVYKHQMFVRGKLFTKTIYLRTGEVDESTCMGWWLKEFFRQYKTMQEFFVDLKKHTQYKTRQQWKKNF